MTKEEYAEELDNKLGQAYDIMGRGGSYDKKDELLFEIIQLFILKEKYELEKECDGNDEPLKGVNDEKY